VKILCRSLFGAAASARLVPSIEAWSLIDHSHSRFCRNSSGPPKMSLFSVVSIWNTLTCWVSTSPIRQAEWCIFEALWSMNDREWIIVWLLWWCFSDLYDASPIDVDLWPPSIATRFTFT
jgi:hypothetical protein